MKQFEYKSALEPTGLRFQTSLYKMVDAIGAGVGVDNIDAIVEIMVELCDKRRLRTIRQGTPIRMKAPVETYRDTAGMSMGAT